MCGLLLVVTGAPPACARTSPQQGVRLAVLLHASQGLARASGRRAAGAANALAHPAHLCLSHGRKRSHGTPISAAPAPLVVLHLNLYPSPPRG